MAVLAGLNSAPVLRLKQAREAIADKKIYKQFQSLDRLMSSDRSVRFLSPPLSFYLPIYLCLLLVLPLIIFCLFLPFFMQIV